MTYASVITKVITSINTWVNLDDRRKFICKRVIMEKQYSNL